MKFSISARRTRGGWRGVVRAHNGAVAFKTMPVFREKKDAQEAARAWLREHGAHADRRAYAHRMHASRRIAYRERKFIPRRFFALPHRAPGRGALPLMDPRKGLKYDPAHVRNAAARLAQMAKRGTVTPSEYREAERRIIHAACASGVERTCRRHLATVSTRMAAYASRSAVPRHSRPTRWGSRHRDPRTGQFV